MIPSTDARGSLYPSGYGWGGGGGMKETERVTHDGHKLRCHHTNLYM
jgi:hypothetical protein